MILAVTLALAQFAAVPAPPQTGSPAERAAAEDALVRGRAWLLGAQLENGAWGHWRNPMPYDRFWSNPATHRAWQVATTALTCTALLDAFGADDPEVAEAVDRGLAFLCEHADVRRPDEWDTDNVWGYVYALEALARAAAEPRYRTEGARADLAGPIVRMGRRMLERLAEYQTPDGGWAYYDEDPTSMPPSWATSFTTAVAVFGLLRARELGWPLEERRLVAALRAIAHCRLPNGAYSYSVRPVPSPGSLWNIDRVQGSLGRIPVCDLALTLGRDLAPGWTPNEDDLVAGLERLFREHVFLDVARGRPSPHEAYHFNSGYFYFFGHCYAGRVLALLPPEEAARFAPQLAHHVVKTMARDGSAVDFFTNDYGRPYATAFAVSALADALRAWP